MQDAVSVCEEINSCLTDYLRVHDDIFKFSITRAIGLRRIDFNDGVRQLRNVADRLQNAHAASARLNNADIDICRSYALSLLAAVKKLESICQALARKANGEPYDWARYNSETNEYAQLQAAYLAQAPAMKQFYKKAFMRRTAR